MLPGDEEAKQIVELASDRSAIVELHDVFPALEVGCGLGEVEASDP
jgi:hypothetical protein